MGGVKLTFNQEYHHNVKHFGSKSGSKFLMPDLGSNCMQMLKVDCNTNCNDQ